MSENHLGVDTTGKDYTEYWGVQYLIVRILQRAGLKVSPRDRLPIFRLWNIVRNRITGAKAENLCQLLQALLNMRMKGMEPPHNGQQYT